MRKSQLFSDVPFSNNSEYGFCEQAPAVIKTCKNGATVELKIPDYDNINNICKTLSGDCTSEKTDKCEKKETQKQIDAIKAKEPECVPLACEDLDEDEDTCNTGNVTDSLEEILYAPPGRTNA